jgi:kynureninase
VTDASALATARRLDAEDPLRSFRARFALPRDARGDPIVYFCGHSLGLAPLDARRLVGEELDRWEACGIDGQFRGGRPWVRYAELLAPGLASLVGAAPHEVVAMNGLSVNLHLLLASFYRPLGARRRVLVESGAFPSDRYIVASQIAWHGLDPATELIELAPRAGEHTLRPEDIEAAIDREGTQLALVLWPGIQYLTGQAFDLARISSAAHRVGALAGFDLGHAIGNVPLALREADADFAAWCSYKYLNAGPGAVAGAFVHGRHHDVPRLAGWWGHEPDSRFLMRPSFTPAAGAAGWQLSNPPILSSAPLLASLGVFADAGMPRLRVKSLALTSLLETLLEALPAGRCRIVTPRDPERRGCQLSLHVAGGRATFDALTASGVACDWREPDIVRVAPAPLYNTFAEVHRFVDALRAATDPVA